MQEALLVSEPRLFKGKGKERQVFLFEYGLVFAKKMELAARSVKYMVKGKSLLVSASHLSLATSCPRSKWWSTSRETPPPLVSDSASRPLPTTTAQT